MIADLTLRWAVTLLFLFSAGVCISSIVRHRHSAADLISHSLHAVMALAMAVMAWPRGAELPSRAPMIFFALAAVWFAAVMVRGAGYHLANGYHTFMMAAMAWMYAAMGGLSLPRSVDTMTMAAPPSSGHAGHAGHMAGMESAAPQSWVGTLNMVCAIGFAAAAAFWLYRLITARMLSEGSRTLGILCQLAMAAGTAVMFAVML